MAKKRGRPNGAGGRRPKKSAGSRARARQEVFVLTVEIEHELNLALEECGKARRWSKKSVVEQALEAFLEAQGFWPRPEPAVKP